MNEFNSGDRVNWQYTPPGGWGYAITIAAIVISYTKKRVKIVIAKKVNEKWVKVVRFTKPEKLSHRHKDCPDSFIDWIDR